MTRWLKVVVGLLIFLLAAWLVDWRRLVDHLQEVSPGAVVLSTGLLVITQIFLLLRWLVILDGRAPAPFAEHARIYLYGMFLNSLTPANLGADLYRVAALRARANGIATLVAVVLRERIFGLLTFFTGYLISIAVLLLEDGAVFRSSPFIVATVLIASGLAAIVLAPYCVPVLKPLFSWRWPAAVSRVIGFVDDVMRFERPSRFLIPLVWSQLAWLGWLISVAVIAGDLGLGLPLAMLGAIVSLAELIRLLPISFQGIGVREASFAFLVGAAGGDPSLGFAVGTIAYLCVSLSILICGPLGWFAGRLAANLPWRPTA